MATFAASRTRLIAGELMCRPGFVSCLATFSGYRPDQVAIQSAEAARSAEGKLGVWHLRRQVRLKAARIVAAGPGLGTLNIVLHGSVCFRTLPAPGVVHGNVDIDSRYAMARDDHDIVAVFAGRNSRELQTYESRRHGAEPKPDGRSTRISKTRLARGRKAATSAPSRAETIADITGDVYPDRGRRHGRIAVTDRE